MHADNDSNGRVDRDLQSRLHRTVENGLKAVVEKYNSIDNIFPGEVPLPEISAISWRRHPSQVKATNR
jgi:hypothetical protein